MKDNAGLIGAKVVVTNAAAPGMWSLSAQARRKGAAEWPDPFLYEIHWLVLAGGGAGGGVRAQTGGGGAGGYRSSWNSETSGGGAAAETSGHVFGAGETWTITVGAGGTRATNPPDVSGISGTPSSLVPNGTFAVPIVSIGGGRGGNYGVIGVGGSPPAHSPPHPFGQPGGSGGGHADEHSATGYPFPIGGTGTAGQGYPGGGHHAYGSTAGYTGGGGGGAGEAGTNTGGGAHPLSSPAPLAGVGGDGQVSTINASTVTRGGGGGGGRYGAGPWNPGGIPRSLGGAGGGGAGGHGDPSGGAATAGGTNLGGGGGGGGNSPTPGHVAEAGGSGVVILRMLTSDYTGTTSGSPGVTTSGSYTILTYNSSGTYTS